MSYATANELANSLKGINQNSDSFHMATVSEIVEGVPYLTMNGETVQREKGYKRLTSYTPAVGDTVLCAKLNGTYTILGKVI